MKIALCQINPAVGDLHGNSRKILDFAARAARQGADLAVFPELCLTGYPPLDLLENPQFMRDVDESLASLAESLPPGLGTIVGAPVPNPAPHGRRLFNAAVLFEGGERLAVVHKTLLPTYDIFDEHRYFESSRERHVVVWRGQRLGIHVCEDMWNNEEGREYRLYRQNPIDDLAALGVDLFINISASPFSLGKHKRRNLVIAESCVEHGVPFVFVNQVGANTEIVFDGDSRVHDADGTRVLCAPSFEEALLLWDTKLPVGPCPMRHDHLEDLHDALVTGIRDYFRKTGAFKKAVIGLSGGIDSAVTCALAVEALGAEKVVGVTMPSRYSSEGSVGDSRALAEAYGIRLHEIAIAPAVDAFAEMLAPAFSGTLPNVAEENIQARVRGVTLMALSNKFDYLLLSTGNKSETAMGYSTLYGDTNGGLAVLADVYKVQVYELARFINERSELEMIPESTITKPPSAELRPGQTDQDSLPPYAVLDRILHLYIEELRDADQIVERTGYDEALVLDVLGRVDRNEYKRRQLPPGIRVSWKAFGSGRRLPIVSRWDRTAHLDPAPAARGGIAASLRSTQ